MRSPVSACHLLPEWFAVKLVRVFWDARPPFAPARRMHPVCEEIVYCGSPSIQNVLGVGDGVEVIPTHFNISNACPGCKQASLFASLSASSMLSCRLLGG